jgi:chemotaxis protein histidine kinase CheA/ActR/RegA family two-component response regulator
MRLDDLLRVMREEFAQAADDIDTRVLTWCGEGAASAEATATAVAQELDRIAQTARIISLEGLGVALEQLRDNTLAIAMLPEADMGVGLTWLINWRAPFDACFAQPGEGAVAEDLLAYLAQGPLATPSATPSPTPSDTPNDSDLTAQLRQLLVAPAVLPADALEDNLSLPPATQDDVALDVPTDVDRDLYDTFLADAPSQVARLADAVALLVRGQLPLPRIQEAQRVAHTFKGSGNIVGVRGVGRLAHRIEDLIEFAAQLGGPLPQAMAHDLEQAVATLDQMLFALRGEEAEPTDSLQRLQALLDWVNAIREERWMGLAAERSAEAEAHSDAFVDSTNLDISLTDDDVIVAVAAPVAPPVSPPVSLPPPTVLVLPTRSAPAAPSGPSETPAAAAPPEAQVQQRVDVSQLDRLVRRAGQDLVRGGRLSEHLKSLDERLRALDQTQRALQQRLAELQVAIDRQGVTLTEKAQADGGGFDPLEMDRYNQLHTLSRFVAELVADENEITGAARAEATLAAASVREHGQSLKEQHRELIHTRMVPFQRAVARLRRTVTQTAGLLSRKVRLAVEGDAVQLDSDVLDRLTEPLLHLLRNAVDHGIESPAERQRAGKNTEGTITLQVKRDGHSVQVLCSDDGQGINLQAVHHKARELGLIAADAATADTSPEALARLILLPGFSTRSQVTETSGRGVGMDVVAERVRSMKGHVDISTQAGLGTAISLRVPATTGAVHALLVEAGGALFALATDSVVSAIAAGDGTFAPGDGSVNGGQYHHGVSHYHHAHLAHWVGLPDTEAADNTKRPVVLVRGAGRTVAISVDRVVDTRELVLQDTGALLRRARGVAGGAFRTDGQVLFVLDTEHLDSHAGRNVSAAAAAQLRQRAQVKRQRVLVVDDAISVRKALQQLLQDAGFDTAGARDGFDALQRLEKGSADIVITDLEMPNLNGLDLTRLLREQAAHATTPIVMITSRSTQKHREAAEAAGVNLYLTKPYTDADLLAQVRSLLAKRIN